MAPGHLQEEVVLGKQWMAQRQCYRGTTKLLLTIPSNNEQIMRVPLVLDNPPKLSDSLDTLQSPSRQSHFHHLRISRQRKGQRTTRSGLNIKGENNRFINNLKKQK